MSSELIAIVFFAIALILLLFGVHIGLALGIAGGLGMVALTGSFSATLGLLRTTPYYTVASYNLTILPLFILMGVFSFYGGISMDAYRAINSWVGRLPGGLMIATTWACVAFGATSGSSVAAASVFTKISLPEMKAAGYDERFACGGIAAAAPIAMLIPPSLFLVIYGMLAEESIAKLLMAGILPGIVMAVVLSLGIWLVAAMRPSLAPISTKLVTWKERLGSTGKAWSIAVLAAIIIGGIYTGVFTPTEAAAVGAFVALVIGLATRKLNWDKLKASLLESLETSAMLFFIMIGAYVFARFLTVSGMATWLKELVMRMELSAMQFVILTVLIYLLLGTFLEALSIMFITMPIYYPILSALDVNLVWYGIVVTVMLNIGAITPPFGMCVYATKAAAGPDVTIEDVFRGTIPYLLMTGAFLAIVVAFPQVSLLLPNMMSK